MQEIHYALILMGAFVAMASPGPATLAIASTSMNQGRVQGLALASGILTGSLFWSCSAAFGLGAVLYANVWLFESLRYVGAVYLLFLAYKSCRSAMTNKSDASKMLATLEIKQSSLRVAYFRGLAIHLTNPKAILFLGSLFAMGMPSSVSTQGLLSVIVLLTIQSACINLGYAVLFSNPSIRQGYFKMKRGFDAVFALMFGVAGIKILLSKVNM
ncbi:LysE family translocator [Marinomonas sp.]|jgi:threonine efflux protein|uniref:LysE family translocator n=1 Tax=Marinomonas sp. TaxID=1904862 RepID=UPI003A91E8B8